ncbi:uncharacterized protein BX663DRAFT_508799, partial [Cokeromyces recurvatus]|uniref:uncharacterized protein n=1 Tax=Cokeromyces recurvatus TaxID=90255 RepID=UPI00222076AD
MYVFIYKVVKKDIFPFSSSLCSTMGIKGAWEFLERKRIFGREITNLNEIQCDKIYVDIVGTFYETFECHFWLCSENDHEKKADAAKKVLQDISLVLNKETCVLCIDGERTKERMKGHERRMEQKLRNQVKIYRLQQKLARQRRRRQTNYKDLMFLITLTKQLFRINRDVETLFARTCKEEGWEILMGDGEAEVAVGRLGGSSGTTTTITVVTNDSDMLFYPKIDILIRPLSGRLDTIYLEYKKSDILEALAITNEAWTALGILAENDYDIDPFMPEKEDSFLDKGMYVDQFEENYNEIIKSSITSTTKNTAKLIKKYIKEFLISMNSKNGRMIKFSTYMNSFRIFALQKEEVLTTVDSSSELIARPQDIINYIKSIGYSPQTNL